MWTAVYVTKELRSMLISLPQRGRKKARMLAEGLDRVLDFEDLGTDDGLKLTYAELRGGWVIRPRHQVTVCLGAVSSGRAHIPHIPPAQNGGRGKGPMFMLEMADSRSVKGKVGG
ncbi:hypothetical protein DL769_006181 [Monosporascus sp. CRB-8-3]|nr:hypothetical protein DL769_006181 [Monosporascus sp. CRB-8-3]